MRSLLLIFALALAGLMRRPMRSLLLIFALALAGCFNPEIEDGGFLCARTRQCPEGFRCVAEGALKVCRKQGSGPFDARLADAHAADARGEARRDLRAADLAADRGPREASADGGGREASADRALREASGDRGRE